MGCNIKMTSKAINYNDALYYNNRLSETIIWDILSIKLQFVTTRCGSRVLVGGERGILRNLLNKKIISSNYKSNYTFVRVHFNIHC